MLDAPALVVTNWLVAIVTVLTVSLFINPFVVNKVEPDPVVTTVP